MARWISYKRRQFKDNGLSEDRVRRLDELGFDWDPYDAAWDEMFSTLVTYKERFGDCNVPIRWSGNPKLSMWVFSQRQKHKGNQGNKLSEDRVRRLDEIGFEWSRAGGPVWEKKFAELVAYKDKFGDCNVPHRRAEYKKLGVWLSNQRQAYKTKMLDEDRIRRLDELDFEWSRRGKRTKSGS